MEPARGPSDSVTLFVGGARLTAIGTCRSQREAFSFVVWTNCEGGDGPIIARVLNSIAFYMLLEEMDKYIAQPHWHAPCPLCGEGVLHVDNFRRKPMGCPAGLPKRWYVRYDYCCSVCRHRQLPPSVRFPGRKVYLHVWIVLISAMTRGPTAKALALLRKELGVHATTVYRWRRWWREAFPETKFFRAFVARLAPGFDVAGLPTSLVDAFGWGYEDVLAMLNAISPVTTASWSVAEGPAM